MAIALAVGGVFSIFQHLGLGVSVAKEVAQDPTPSRLGIIALLVLGVRILMLIPILAILVFVVAPTSIHLYDLPNLDYLIQLFALFILVSSPGDILSYTFTGAGKYKTYFKLKFINELVLTCSVCTMIYWMKVEGYFIGQIIAAAIYTTLSGYALWKTVEGQTTRATRSEIRLLLSSIFKTSTSTYTAKLCRSFSLQAPILLAGYYLPITSVGALKFGMQAGGYIATITSAAQLVTLPKMISHLRAHGKDYLFEKFSQNFRRLNFVLCYILIFAVLLAPILIRIIGGSNFISSVTPFQIIVIYYILIVSADTIFTGIYFPLNRETSYVKSYIFYFALSIITGGASLLFFKTAESSLFGVFVGAVAHLIAAVILLKQHTMLFKKLGTTVAKQLVLTSFACAIAFFDLLLIKLLFGGIGLAIISIDVIKSEPKLMRNLYTTVKNRLTK